jgi:hypothetical protein
MKMRAFVPPGEIVELQIDFEADSGENRIMFKTAARVRGKRAGMGTLEIESRVGR